MIRTSKILIGRFGSEGRNLIALAMIQNHHRSVLNAGINGLFENFLDFPRVCARGDINVMNRKPKQRVTDASADKISFKAGLLDRFNNRFGIKKFLRKFFYDHKRFSNPIINSS